MTWFKRRSRRRRDRLGQTAVVASVACLFAMGSSRALAQCQLAQLLASEGEAGDEFGYSVAISGQCAIVGAPLDDNDNGIDAGTAYVFCYNGSEWVLQCELLAPDGQAGDRFGWSVGISGDLAIVGAYGHDDVAEDSGAAYLFDVVECEQLQKLIASDGGSSARFGFSVGISGNAAVVGAVWDSNENGSGAGAAYVFVQDGIDWTEQQKLIAWDGLPADSFGCAVAISGDWAVIGSHQDDNQNGGESGSAYGFERDGDAWEERSKLLAEDGESHDHFGMSVSIDNEIAVIGAPYDDDHFNNSGSAYVFDVTTGNQTQKLTAEDAAADDRFGDSVSVGGETAMVGSHSGCAYVYDATSGEQIAILTAEEGEVGFPVSMDEELGIVGAPNDDTQGNNAGAAYVFAGLEGGPDCNENGITDFCDILTGFSEDCQPNGIPDECDIADGVSEDCNSNGVPDECEECCPGDVTGDGKVDIDDIFEVLAHWGDCPG